MDNLLAIPIFLYQTMYILFSSAIPLLIIFVILRWIIGSIKKLFRTTFN